MEQQNLLKNKDVIFFESSNKELIEKIRLDIMYTFSKLRPWIFVYKLWNGLEQKEYYVISVMNEYGNSYDETTIDLIQLHIFNINLNFDSKNTNISYSII